MLWIDFSFCVFFFFIYFFSWCVISDWFVYFLTWECWKLPRDTWHDRTVGLWLGLCLILFSCFIPNKLDTDGIVKNWLIFQRHLRVHLFKRKCALKSFRMRIITLLFVLKIKVFEFNVFLKEERKSYVENTVLENVMESQWPKTMSKRYSFPYDLGLLHLWK